MRWHFTTFMFDSPRFYFFAALLLPVGAFSQSASLRTEGAVPADVKDHIKKVSETGFKIGVVSFDSQTKEIRFPALVNLRQGENLEYAIVSQNGKTHESLLRTAIKPMDLSVAMLLLGYEGSADHIFDEIQDPEKKPTVDAKALELSEPQVENEKSANNRVKIRIMYPSAEDGGEKEVRLEDWIFDKTTMKPMAPRFWVFTGSEMLESGLRADTEGDVVAIYLAAGSLFNNPGEGNTNDELWTTLPAGLPAKNTAVTVVISPFEGDEP